MVSSVLETQRRLPGKTKFELHFKRCVEVCQLEKETGLFQVDGRACPLCNDTGNEIVWYMAGNGNNLITKV